MDNTTTIRVKKDSYDTMKLMAKEKNMTMQDILDEAIKDYRKKEFFDKLNAAYTILKADTNARKEEEKERAAWDSALQDGLED